MALTGERSFPGLAWRIERRLVRILLRPTASVGQSGLRPVHAGLQRRQRLAAVSRQRLLEFGRDPDRALVRAACLLQRRSRRGVHRPTGVARLWSFSRSRVPAAIGSDRHPAGGAGVHFASFCSTRRNRPVLARRRRERTCKPGTVPGWWVSNIVAEGSAPAAARTWTYLEAEPSGLANLARVNPLGTTLNTVLARTTIVAQNADMRATGSRLQRPGRRLPERPSAVRRPRRLPLARLPLSWLLSATGTRSFCPLTQGDNELVVAVSETFGGWGLKGRIADPTGLSFQRSRADLPSASDGVRVVDELARVASSQVMSGSARNQVRWRRASCRLRAMLRSIASASGSPRRERRMPRGSRSR